MVHDVFDARQVRGLIAAQVSGHHDQIRVLPEFQRVQEGPEVTEVRGAVDVHIGNAGKGEGSILRKNTATKHQKKYHVCHEMTP